MNIQYARRTKPKGYNSKVWLALIEEAFADKKWAFETVKNPEWTQKASTVSLQMLGERLCKTEHELAKSAYDYLKMRAFGETFIGPLDASARRRWEALSGRKVPRTQIWNYNHHNNTTSAIADKKGWKHPYTGRKI